ncbi:MAG: ABC transporter ATP-binding protein/permease [Deltaproteobacteria bacterium]|nr:ABC transporter ATP-binding protein/permease [Deltaproteobacteria bacterium]
MGQTKRSLWERFIKIAQPYFFPDIRGGSWAMLLLLIMLVVFLFGVLFLIIAGMTWTANHFAPVLTAKIASGLFSNITEIFNSKGWLIFAGFLIVPPGIFMLFGRHIRSRRRAWVLLATVLLLSLSMTGINVAFSYITNYFTNALVEKNQDLAYLFVGVYFCGFMIGIPIVAFYFYVLGYLGMRWREWLTNEFLRKYFSNRSYYEIETLAEIDNPDQRIMEDIRSFTRTSLWFLLILMGSLMDLFSFTGILWSKSVLLVVVVLGYSLVGTLLTFLIGRRLIGLNFNQLRYEADFRYSLVHVRDNAESIAFYQGEKPELAQIGGRFKKVLGNFNLLIGWQRNLSFFTTGYSYLPAVLPFIVLFPQYFSGQINYGDMMQANFAFLHIYAALSLIVSQMEQITTFAASIERLSTFADAITPTPVHGIQIYEADRFALKDVTLLTPDKDRTLFQNLTMDLEGSNNLVVGGQSGVGKSSLLRAIAGLWTQGSGIVLRPPLEEIFFLPQKPYMLLGSLRDQMLYPRMELEIPEDELRRVLESVNLADLPERSGGFKAKLVWADVLSLGEQQRLAFARLFINHPGFAVLDEATSALDGENEAMLYQKLQELDIHYISVGHRSSILDYHDHVLELQGQDKWELLTVDDYKVKMSKIS